MIGTSTRHSDATDAHEDLGASHDQRANLRFDVGWFLFVSANETLNCRRGVAPGGRNRAQHLVFGSSQTGMQNVTVMYL